MRGIAEPAMAIAQEAIDAAAPQDVRAVVAADQDGAPQHPEVRLDEDEPAGLGRGEGERHAKMPGERKEAWVVVDVAQVVEHHEHAPARVAGPQPAEGFTDLAQPLLLAEDPREHVGVHVIEAEEDLGNAIAVEGRAHPHRLPVPGPAQPADGPELERTPLIEADDLRAGRAVRTEGADAPPFEWKSGSVDVFQVRMRWLV